MGGAGGEGGAGGAAHPCAGGGGCEGLCLWGGGGARCVCPHGELAPDGRTCTRTYLPTLAALRSPLSALRSPLALSVAASKSFLMYTRVTAIDSINLDDQKDLNSPYPPIENK